MGGVATELSRLVAAVIAALRIVAKGGLIPHARQGGIGVDAVAVDGSKLEGTGLEKLHIGHTHVAFTGGGSPALGWCTEFGVRGDCDREGLAPALFDRSMFFSGLGYTVIFGEDFQKLA